mmetsp:Transcript_140697/g.245050  ORF Transcript_140697/g.245050 Transcript_140697/m.245050 type:complete len:432 (-) Transcript_140697:459-1754(-)
MVRAVIALHKAISGAERLVAVLAEEALRVPLLVHSGHPLPNHRFATPTACWSFCQTLRLQTLLLLLGTDFIQLVQAGIVVRSLVHLNKALVSVERLPAVSADKALWVPLLLQGRHALADDVLPAASTQAHRSRFAAVEPPTGIEVPTGCFLLVKDVEALFMVRHLVLLHKALLGVERLLAMLANKALGVPLLVHGGHTLAHCWLAAAGTDGIPRGVGCPRGGLRLLLFHLLNLIEALVVVGLGILPLHEALLCIEGTLAVGAHEALWVPLLIHGRHALALNHLPTPTADGPICRSGRCTTCASSCSSLFGCLNLIQAVLVPWLVITLYESLLRIEGALAVRAYEAIRVPLLLHGRHALALNGFPTSTADGPGLSLACRCCLRFGLLGSFNLVKALLVVWQVRALHKALLCTKLTLAVRTHEALRMPLLVDC